MRHDPRFDGSNRDYRLDVSNRCCSGPGGIACYCCYDGADAYRRAIRASRRIIRLRLRLVIRNGFSD